ncbi:MAG: DeoR/GlpR family DNA-binding transcription regulator [Treponemataceae bacterium]|jgi:DeoR family transcriptional regulator of aga operon/DeoR family fructose operon transcriptional repressor|nr:MAG: DeoR/GlpR family DNA-binding transcription regulator [Treponemataceae bacterium]
MLHERRKDIVEKIRQFQTLKIGDLAAEFKVSIETIRRDLEFLEKQGQLRRVYGGAVLNGNYSFEEAEYGQRELINRPQKRAIGEKAASLINDGDTLFIDTGTTTRELARHLGNKRRLTILTTATLVAHELARCTDSSCGIILLGGEMRRDELAVSGAMTCSNLSDFYIATTVIGLGGISVQTGITDYHLPEVPARRLAIERAKTVIGLADYSKFGVTAVYYVCPAAALNILVTDWGAGEAAVEEYRGLGITVHCAQKEGET